MSPVLIVQNRIPGAIPMLKREANPVYLALVANSTDWRTRQNTYLTSQGEVECEFDNVALEMAVELLGADMQNLVSLVSAHLAGWRTETHLTFAARLDNIIMYRSTFSFHDAGTEVYLIIYETSLESQYDLRVREGGKMIFNKALNYRPQDLKFADVMPAFEEDLSKMLEYT